jgi:two-component system sensor histidine kinase UhpB
LPVRFARVRHWWDRAPILYKVLIGNAIVIVVGAIGGVYLTDLLVDVSGTALALFFATVGILFSLVINYVILRSALRPMERLQRTVERIDRGDTAVRAPVEEIGDPQLKSFAQALNTMLGRLAAHMRMIERNRAQLRRLSGQVLSAQEDERKRIARELHDDTSGALARVLLNLEMCEELLPEDLAEVRAKMRATSQLTEQTLENVRKLIFDLRPTLLDDLGLAPAVRWIAKNTLEPVGVQVHFETNAHLGRAAAPVETAMFRIAQEAVTNIARHAEAHHARLSLSLEQSNLVLCIEDDGKGFDVAASERETNGNHHWGLFGLRERVELLGGTLQLKSEPGRGTSLRVEIPVN